MAEVRVRRMTDEEHRNWERELARDYAAEMVEAGIWPSEGAEERARAEHAEDLPLGLDTPGMLLLTGVDTAGEPVGRAWVVLDHARSAPGTAYLYDIEVRSELRGRGLGRALLEAVERAAADAGATAMGLSVFGQNRTAAALYTSSGYEIVRQQMRKDLGDRKSA